MPTQFTTSLPDAQQPSLGNGVEDEIQVSWTDVINNGEYDVEYRETSSSTWLTGPSVDEASTSTTVAGLEDGEEYEVRARTETEHVVGAWTSPVAITTKFPGVTEFTVDVVDATSISLDGQDNADNESGIEIVREELIGGEWADATTIRDLPPQEGTGSFTVVDETVHPDRTYRYRARPYTEHTDAFSDWTQANTDSLDVAQDRRAKSSGWYVEVEHASGRVRTPRVLDTPQRTPAVNDQPAVRIPVPKSEGWQDSGFEDATLHAWKDGRRQPIDTLVDVEDTPRETILHATGGNALDTRVQREIDQDAIHEIARDIIQNDLPYTANVDDPPSTVTEDVLMQNPDSTQDWTELVQDRYQAGDWPLEVTSGYVAPLQTCWTREGEDYDRSEGGVTLFSADRFSGAGATSGDGEAVLFDDAGEAVEYDIQVDHDIPAGEFEIPIFYDGSLGQDETIDCIFNGQTLGTLNLGAGDVTWLDLIDIGFISDPGAVDSGTHTLRFEATGTWSGGSLRLDVVAPHDQRFPHTFDDTVTTAPDGTNYLDSPGYYAPVEVEFTDAVTSQAIIAGAFTGVFSSTSEVTVELSNDQGATWPVSSTDTGSVSGEFPDSGGTIRARVTLGGSGSREETPATGFDAITLDSMTLTADLDTTPLLLNRSLDNNALDVLQTLARDGDYVFALTWQDGGMQVEWTKPGQRESGVDLDLVDYSSTKTTRESAERAIVQGSNQSVDGERWTAQHGTGVPLGHERLLPGSVSVSDPSTGELYEEGSDFVVDRSAGEITALASGTMTDDTEYTASYEWQTYGEYALDGAEDTAPFMTEEIGATSNRACGQAAYRLVQTLREPRYEAEIVIPSEEAGWDVVSALSLDALPFDNEYVQVRGVDASPGEVRVQLRSHGSAGDVIEEFNTRIQALSGRV